MPVPAGGAVARGTVARQVEARIITLSVRRWTRRSKASGVMWILAHEGMHRTNDGWGEVKKVLVRMPPRGGRNVVGR